MTSIIYEKRSFNHDELSSIDSIYLNNYPIVYILYNKKKRPTAYIGQTVQAKRRMTNHFKNPQRKVLAETILIGHEEFNQSATYNIETNLINYFIADNRYRLQNVSQTSEKQIHNYFRKDYYNQELFNEVWEKLRQENIVDEKIETLANKDLFKLSPYKELSEKQLEIKNNILEYCKQNISKNHNHVFLIEGDAGTGKSVVLSSLFNTIQDYANDNSTSLANTENYLLVNHGEMIKTYQTIASSLPNLKKKSFMKPTSFINKMDKASEKADIVLVDEAHLLLSKEDAYNNFRYQNHLEEIIKRSKVTIVIFDPKQVLKIKSYWNKDLLQQITKNYSTTTFSLEDQFRIDASPEIPKWIDRFVEKKLTPIPQLKNEKFELKIFENSDNLKDAIINNNKKYGLSRIVSTFDYIHKKDGSLYYVDEDGLNMPWNITKNNKTWAEEADTIREVGSIYTVQGFDLNYVGVILGPSISYDDTNEQLLIDTSKYKDTEAFRTRKDLSYEENEQAKEDIILNSINILLKRGIKGLYIYATDPKLRSKLLSLQGDENT
ncbi:hypothetical protein SAMN04487943_103353 [Gracilibacillus orientalis]|uniref:GIY-YIG domain-containing protein n=1 Tax=Gracilibacillus orientalis TaxID=334253 RepID=A0A1I4K5J0_9BACI|nr:DUF2075 domain-containing protein [Gracilibacillus orientalis]SFL73736.1 hypothetical protein SAMN04487943_103353 [Gracilibacillus orientalis]